MKALWASVILFGLLLILVCWNAIYIHKSAEELRTLTSKLDEPSTRWDTLSRLDELWKSRRAIIGFSLGDKQLDRLSEMIDSLLWAYSVSDEAEFERYRILLTDAIDEIERAENLSVENLF